MTKPQQVEWIRAPLSPSFSGQPLQYMHDHNGRPVPAKNLVDLEEFRQHESFRLRTQVTPDVYVSTVFLSINHAFMPNEDPVLWETMVFGGKLGKEQERYTSQKAAEIGHEAMVTRVREAEAE